jgi:hypothetical protein
MGSGDPPESQLLLPVGAWGEASQFCVPGLGRGTAYIVREC